MISVGIVGGTGYTGVELLRLLLQHPNAEVKVLTSRTENGRRVDDMFPSLRGHTDLKYSDLNIEELKQCDAVFFATPHGVAMKHAEELVAANTKVIDLAADFRLQDLAQFEKWYGMQHACPDVLKASVYGLSELNREQIKQASVIGNPGCYPTAVQLGFLPLVEAGVIELDSLVADAKSGVSGAGRKAETHILFSESADNFQAYGVAGHRHLPEIRQGLSRYAQAPVGLTFVPHLTPMIRGIHATLYATVADRGVDLQALFEQRYANEPFVDVMPAGSHPETRSVRGANVCRIAVHRPQGGELVVVLSEIGRASCRERVSSPV